MVSCASFKAQLAAKANELASSLLEHVRTRALQDNLHVAHTYQVR